MPQPCPKCKNELSRVPGRASRLRRCAQCKGTWFPRDEARLEAAAELLSADSTLRPGGAADARTGLCPDGHGILIRARIDVEEPFFLERCAECHGIWFDKGEWARLAESHLFHHLDRLWDPAFRYRESDRQEGRREQLEGAVGAATVELIDTLATSLREQPAAVCGLALAYLSERLDER